MDINSIAASVIVWVVTALLGYIIGKAHEYKKAQQQKDTERANLDKAMQMGMRSLLRDAIRETHRRCMAETCCELDDKEVIERDYQAYHTLGGNGTGTRLYEEVMALPIKND